MSIKDLKEQGVADEVCAIFEECNEKMFQISVEWAKHLETLDLDFMIEHAENANLKDAFLALAEFKSGMAPVLRRGKELH